MKESTQTLCFLLAALVAVGVATQVQPTDTTYQISDLVGKNPFPPFEAEAAKSLRIVRFNEEAAELSEFEVAEKNGVWSLPSKGGYPADAERQMAEATTGVIDLEILSIASESAADHEKYGVVEPSGKLEVGATGVGARITLNDDSNTPLVDIIIGKQVKGTTDQHYVRRKTQDLVFTVKIDPEKFTTSFEDWIEDDLLDLNNWDVARVLVRDYTAELVMQGFQPTLRSERRGEYEFDFNDDENNWTPRALRAYDREAKDYVSFELQNGETLNETTLNDLKTAVGDLRIVDVERKPTGLSADLQAGEDFLGDESGILSLMRRGFAPIQRQDGTAEIVSSEGEVIVTTSEGVEYVLRFGNLQIDGEATGPSESEAAGEESGGGVNRYLFVMARVNEGQIEKPELEEVPEAAEGNEGEEPEEESDAQQEIAAIKDRNQRAQDEYEAKLERARKRVNELNARFGDWYYVIADDIYKKVAVGRNELIESVEPDADQSDTGSEGEGGIPGLPNIPGIGFGAEATTPDEPEAPAADAAEAAEESTEATE